MHQHFFASYPCLLMYECGYTSTAFHKRNLSRVNIYAHCVFCSQHLFHFETHSFKCGWRIQIQTSAMLKNKTKQKSICSNDLVPLLPRSLVRVEASLRSAR